MSSSPAPDGPPDRLAAVGTIGRRTGDVGGRFMLDPATYAHGATLGFEGIDFYHRGRGGVLGEVPGPVIAAAFTFLGHAAVAEGWERGRSVMPADAAAAAFIDVGHRWGRERLSPDLPAGRYAELAGAVAGAADPSACCLFAAWREWPWPDDDRARALHAVHLLRELRGGAHALAVRAHGLAPHEAVLVKGGPGVAGFLGWPEPHPDVEHLRDRWAAAEAATDALVLEAAAVLDDGELAELAALSRRLLP